MAVQRIVWTQAMEAQLVELWQAHPSLFDVASKNYHDRNKRDRSWMEIAAQLQLPVNEVKTRVASLRTQYGKLLKPKPSGSGQKPPTPKQTWILKHLDFLKAHVVHRQTESTLRVIRGATEEGDEDQSTMGIEADVLMSSNTTSPVSVSQEEENTSNSPPISESTGRLVKRPRVQKHAPKSAEHSIEMTKLSLLQQVQQTLSASNADSEELFGQQVASELRNIKDRALQLRLKRNIMNMIYDTQEAEQGGHHSQFVTASHLGIPPNLIRSSPPPDCQAPPTQPMCFLKMLNSE
ncbi:interferon gamma receptor 1 [Sarotherodon galilaeus]